MQETKYTTEETERIRSHFLACQSAGRAGEANESLSKCGLPAEYAVFAESIARAVVEQHGIAVPSAAFVIAGMTVGFALGRDFGRAEMMDVAGEAVAGGAA